MNWFGSLKVSDIYPGSLNERWPVGGAVDFILVASRSSKLVLIHDSGQMGYVVMSICPPPPPPLHQYFKHLPTTHNRIKWTILIKKQVHLSHCVYINCLMIRCVLWKANDLHKTQKNPTWPKSRQAILYPGLLTWTEDRKAGFSPMVVGAQAQTNLFQSKWSM